MKGVGRLIIALGLALSSLAAPLAVSATADSDVVGHGQVSVIVPNQSQAQDQGNGKGDQGNQGNGQGNPSNQGNGQSNQGNGQNQGQGTSANQGNQNGNKGGGPSTGSAWTQRSPSGGGEPANGNGNNANHYTTGNTVYLNGQNFAVGTYTVVLVRVSPQRSVDTLSTDVSVDNGIFYFGINTAGLPMGEYRVEIRDSSGHKVASDNFRLGGPGNTAVELTDPGTPPTDPNVPGNPGNPTDVGNPSNPGTPSNPGNPGTPAPHGTPSETGVIVDAPTKAGNNSAGGMGPVVAVASAAQGPSAVVLGEQPYAPAAAMAAVSAAAPATGLPKAGLPPFAPLFLFAGSLLTGIGYTLRRLV
ncbi:MAG: hypothetical protein ACYC3S_17000 [Chloroflexota bacterium]